MPTGYTSEIYEGKEISAKEFILKCARAFGATVTMRDEPLDAEIPEFQPSDYYLKALEREKEDLEKYENITIEELQKELDDSFKIDLVRYHKRIKENIELEGRYNKVLEEVKKWNPPTNEHVNLKNYAIEQLLQSIEHDCNRGYLTAPTRINVAEYLKFKIDNCRQNIARYQEQWDEEVERTNERNKWVKGLKESLK